MTGSALWQLAQVNVARMLAPLDSAQLQGFVARLDEINALADRSPGFVWRLQNETGSAAYLRPYDDDRILFNLSVWQTSEQLKAYVYRSAHVELVRQRKSWFSHFGASYIALWWVPAGHLPTIEEAKERLARLQEIGESAEAFGFGATFPPSL